MSDRCEHGCTREICTDCEIEELHERVEDLEKDALRLDWLSKSNVTLGPHPGVVGKCGPFAHLNIHGATYEDLQSFEVSFNRHGEGDPCRAVIDKAMAAEAEKGEE